MRVFNFLAKVLPFIALALLLFACASTNLMERADGSYSLVAHSYSDSAALGAATEKAREHCKSLGKHFALLERREKTPQTKVNVIVNTHARPAYGSAYAPVAANDSEEHSVELHFLCK